MNGESPFQPTNRKLTRTPPPKEKTQHPNTRSQSKDKAKIKETQQVQPKIVKVNKVNNETTKMNQQQIQQTIANFIPEFSGENTSTNSRDLTRFINTANAVFEMLTTEEERKTFEKLIKLRLVGEAYTRISNRDIQNYPEMRELLSKMYAQPYSLDELERQFTTTRQTYSETIRNYGYRIIEALEKYKSGFKASYKMESQIDNVYNRHLNESAINTFKRGLNNTILREKIATYKANTVEELINETEAIEKMLKLLTDPMEIQTQRNVEQNFTNRKPYQNSNQHKQTVICNYCQRPNHTYDVCRTRMQQERNKPNQNYRSHNSYNNNNNFQNTRTNVQNKTHPNYQNTPNYNQQPQNQHQTNYRNYQNNPHQHQTNYQTNSHQHQTNYRNYQNNTHQHQTNYQNNPQSTTFNPQHNHNNNSYPKYCSHCKTTKSHTFDECRSKFFPPRTNQYNQPNNQDAQQELTRKFENMRINTIYPQQTDNYETYNQLPNQGNEQGSSQQ